jgi:hypothetical protein
MTRSWKHLARILVAGLIPAATGCIWIVHQVEVVALPARGDSVATRSPVKVHLRDGFTVVYRDGLTISRDTLRGNGVRYDRRLADPTLVTLVPRDSVVAMESFDTRVNAGKTVGFSALTTGSVIAIAAVIYSSNTTVPYFLLSRRRP